VTRVLLITGARSLATRPGAEAWARGLIAAALAGVDLLIVGDAEGPDAWAYVEAARESLQTRRRLPVHMYYARGSWAGRIYRYAPQSSDTPWCEHVPPYGTPQRQRLPLLRNAAMVRDIAAMRDAGAVVSVLALLDGIKVDAPGKRATRGTEYTVGLARAAGLTVREEVWRG